MTGVPPDMVERVMATSKQPRRWTCTPGEPTMPDASCEPSTMPIDACLLPGRAKATDPYVRVRAIGFGRGGGIRTHDLFVPNEARYQAAPHPEAWTSLADRRGRPDHTNAATRRY